MNEHMREKFEAWFPYKTGEAINMVRDVAWDAWQAATAEALSHQAEDSESWLKWCHSCGEGYDGTCRGKSVNCPMK